MFGKNFNKFYILLSVTALLAILCTGVGVTYSWIEGKNSVTILTEDGNPLKTDTLPASVSYMGAVRLDPDAETVLSLTDYDKTSGQGKSLCFSPVSSADGKNFFFPNAYGTDGAPISYRKSNTNDIGTKFISFNFDVQATAACALAFNGKPTVSVQRDGQPVADTSAFRMMISDGTEAGTHIFSFADTVQQSAAVTSVDAAKTTLTTEIFDNYLSNVSGSSAQSLCSFGENASGNIAVAVWLDEADATDIDFFGCEVTVDISLAVKPA